MKKRKGLVYIGFGLFTVGVWFSLYCLMEDQFGYQYPTTASSVVIAALHDIPGTFLQIPWSFVAVVGLVLIGIGIYRLVWSSFHTWDDEEAKGRKE